MLKEIDLGAKNDLKIALIEKRNKNLKSHKSLNVKTAI